MDIDIVVLWVDGSDPAWLAEKNRCSPKTVDDSNSANRFRDWGLMKYWFRSIEAFAPWVRKIHFVTWGHLPPFLNTEHPKLHIVRHEDYIPGEWLPTFSSHTLEMNMHRIPDLAEHFIYFNDDTFLIRPVLESGFFRDGLPCAQATEVPLNLTGEMQVWQSAAVNDLCVINEQFGKRAAKRAGYGKFCNYRYHWYDNIRTAAFGVLIPNSFLGFKIFHCPAAFCKSTFEEIWDKKPELLKSTSSHRFRSKDDVNQWLAQWWQIASGHFAPKRIDGVHCPVNDSTIDQICCTIEGQTHEMICVSDPDDETDFDLLSHRLQKSFQSILPNKSNFER